jgi:hypothetical protein
VRLNSFLNSVVGGVGGYNHTQAVVRTGAWSAMTSRCLARAHGPNGRNCAGNVRNLTPICRGLRSAIKTNGFKLKPSKWNEIVPGL